MKTKAVFLIGPPAVGKSHWLEHEAPKHGITNPFVISRDNLVDTVAADMGRTYDDMFARDGNTPEIDEANRVINSLLQSHFHVAKEHDCIVIDMTNMSRKTRMRNWNRLGLKKSNTEKIAVVFHWNDDMISLQSNADRRSDQIRARGGSKTIPAHVLERMVRDFQPPQPDEQFDYVIEVQPWWTK